MFHVDLHTHTRFFHGHPQLGERFDPLGVRLLAGMARFRGIDGFATTNHDYGTGFDTGDRPTIIPGIEITTTDGHLLVVGPDPPSGTTPGELTPAEAVALAHDRECAAIIAHPYRNSTIRKAEAGADAIEINGKGLDHDRVARLADRMDLPLVGGSDAHYPIEIGRAATRVEAEELTPESVVDAIRDGRVTATLHDSPSQRMLRSVYRFIHTRKGWLERPTPPGLGAPPDEGEELEPADIENPERTVR